MLILMFLIIVLGIVITYVRYPQVLTGRAETTASYKGIKCGTGLPSCREPDTCVQYDGFQGCGQPNISIWIDNTWMDKKANVKKSTVIGKSITVSLLTNPSTIAKEWKLLLKCDNKKIAYENPAKPITSGSSASFVCRYTKAGDYTIFGEYDYIDPGPNGKWKSKTITQEIEVKDNPKRPGLVLCDTNYRCETGGCFLNYEEQIFFCAAKPELTISVSRFSDGYLGIMNPNKLEKGETYLVDLDIKHSPAGGQSNPIFLLKCSDKNASYEKPLQGQGRDNRYKCSYNQTGAYTISGKYSYTDKSGRSLEGTVNYPVVVR